MRRPFCIIVPDTKTSETIQRDLSLFLQWENEEGSVHLFPAWEILPYEPLSPFQGIAGERLASLDSLSRDPGNFLVVPAPALLQKVISKRTLRESTFFLSVGEDMDRELLIDCLMDSGYERADMVTMGGEFSMRGGILDIFPSHVSLPVRLEFFGDRIESLRRFDPASQRSVGRLKDIRILPARELILNKKILERGCREIEKGVVSSQDRKNVTQVLEKFKNLFPFPGAEMYASYFYQDGQSPLDYLPKETLLVLEEPEQITDQLRAYGETIHAGYRQAVERGDVPPLVRMRYLAPEEVLGALTGFQSIEHRLIHTQHREGVPLHPVRVQSVDSFKGRFKDFAVQVSRWRQEGWEMSFVAATKAQTGRIRELLIDYETDCEGVVGNISTGFILPESRYVIVAEDEIFGIQHVHRTTPGKGRGRRLLKAFEDLKPGDLVVHVDYGIGEFLGVHTMDGLDDSPEFLELLYAEGEKLYLPMDRLDRVQKYFGAEKDSISLDRLGGVAWEKNKARARKAIMEMAQDLLKLYAARKVAEGVSYSMDTFMHREFDDSFIHTETPDQARAIEEVKRDLEDSKPMDRLICGDVGYGKTEVAMRAAFKVTHDGRQVALLAPTTVLTQQHLQTFEERFSAWPIRIRLLNRFCSLKEEKEIICKVEAGEVDILIGTHKILRKNIRFKNLGLVIIDEEQRFGVKDKEKLKHLKKQVDVLTMTATPIPRTLHFSLVGLRNISIIETPPRDRLAIRTYTRQFHPAVIKEALQREMGRGGQAFFVHNRVENIHTMADYVQRLIPGARIEVAHGQMKAHGLEKVMMRFLNKEIDVLVCTTIIESGLDIPSANTIIINRADKFGLAQLYQLRGRVGRYKHQAYAYLLIPGELSLEKKARKRLRAIEELSDLGAGFHLAARDLEIRGTGNLLGHQQSGNIVAIGYEMYARLLEDTVRELKGERLGETMESEILLEYKGAIPRSYIPFLNQRLETYRRLYMAGNMERLHDLKEELCDRFGSLPLPVEKLVSILELKLLARRVMISEIRQRSGRVQVSFHKAASFHSEKLVSLAKTMHDRLRILPDHRLSLEISGVGWKHSFLDVKELLEGLQPIINA